MEENEKQDLNNAINENNSNYQIQFSLSGDYLKKKKPIEEIKKMFYEKLITYE